jgi:hypothetical protein
VPRRHDGRQQRHNRKSLPRRGAKPSIDLDREAPEQVHGDVELGFALPVQILIDEPRCRVVDVHPCNLVGRCFDLGSDIGRHRCVELVWHRAALSLQGHDVSRHHQQRRRLDPERRDYVEPVSRRSAVTGNSVNGWILWEVKRRGDNDFIKLDWLRSIPSLDQL